MSTNINPKRWHSSDIVISLSSWSASFMDGFFVILIFVLQCLKNVFFTKYVNKSSLKRL
nr:hypothetical protein [Flavobacterium sp. 1]